MTTLPTYAQVAKALATNPSQFDPAEVHGLMCGLICTTGAQNFNWKAQLLGSKPNPKSLEILEQLYEATSLQLAEFSLGLKLILPEDKTDIGKRTESLGLFCQGFLIGLGQSTYLKERPLCDESKGALRDITEISRVDYTDMQHNETEEVAYVELSEYVRLGVIMLYHDLKQKTVSNAGIKNHLH